MLWPIRWSWPLRWETLFYVYIFMVAKNIYPFLIISDICLWLVSTFILCYVFGSYRFADNCILSLPLHLLHTLQVKQSLGTPRGFPTLLGVSGDLNPPAERYLLSTYYICLCFSLSVLSLFLSLSLYQLTQWAILILIIWATIFACIKTHLQCASKDVTQDVR